MLTIFALQDSFGTACNIVGDGAIALMLTGIYKRISQKHNIYKNRDISRFYIANTFNIIHFT